MAGNRSISMGQIRLSHGITRCAAAATGLVLFIVAASPAEADPKPKNPIVFTDVTVKSGIDFIQTIGDDEMTNIVESAGVGCGFLDYDGDGWLDIYLVNGCWQKGLSDPELDAEERKRAAAATDRLYRNRGDGTFQDVTISAGLAKSDYGMGVVAADYDGDGDVDIYVTNYGPNRLYRNNGDGTFTDVAKSVGVDDPEFSVGAVFFDYDKDGRLDLYVGNYVAYEPDYRYFYAPDGFPGPLAYTGQQDHLYHANSDGTFTDVSQKAGIVVEPIGRAMGVGAFDHDGDGWLDVFVSNDAMENFFFHNQGDGTFKNEAMIKGLAFGENGDATAAMGVELADFNGDGLIDLFVPDMTFTCLYRNMGDGFFEDEAAKSGIAAVMGQYVGWSGAFADFDLDGHVDLFVSNGDVHHLEPHEDVLFRNDGTGDFMDVSETAGDWMAEKYVGRGVARGDIDNDGDIDLLVTNLDDRPGLLRNDTKRNGVHWLTIRLVGKAPNREAIGAMVKVTAGGRTLVQQQGSSGGYLSQHDRRLHFGLGRAKEVRRIEVIWPDGSKESFKDIDADRELTISQRASGKERSGI